MEQDDIDLRPYATALARRWYWIVLAALLLAVAAASAGLLQSPTYSATASVLLLIRQTGSQLGVDQPLVTIETIDVNARRQALVALAQSTAVETRLPADVLREVVSSNYQPGMLLGRDRVAIEAQGDLLLITGHGPSPQQAKALADGWATTYVDSIQTLYRDEHSQAALAGAAVLPFEPSGPPLLRYAALGAVLGMVLSSLLVVLHDVVGLRLLPSRRTLIGRRSSVAGSR